MKDLNSQQIVLLCLLVSFVTSIATGITAVSLMNQAPTPVSHTIQRVVEKTIEKVVPTEEKSNVTVTKTPEKEVVTVVVKEEDLTIDAVEKNSASLARIHLNTRERPFIGLGLVISEKGDIVTDANILASGKKFIAVINDKEFIVTVTPKKGDDRLVILSIQENPTAAKFSPATFADSQNLRLAQSVISLSGISRNTVSTGIVTELKTVDGFVKEDESTPNVVPEKQITSIITSVDRSNVLFGSVLINLQGEVVGMKIRGHSEDSSTFMPSSLIQAFVKA